MDVRIPGATAMLAALAPLAILCACDDGGAGCPEEGPHECSWEDAFDPAACPSMAGFEQCVVFVDPSVECSGSGSSWSGAKKSVQEAVDAAACGALNAGMCATWQVWLREGTHRVNRGCVEDTLRLRSHVEIYGGFAGDETALSQRDPGAHPAVLDGEAEGGGGRVNNVVLAQSVAGAALDGLTIRGGEAAIDAYVCAGGKTMQGGGGVALLDGDLAVRGCAFEGNDSANFGGAISSFFSELAVSGSSFSGNCALKRAGAIFGTESTLSMTGSSLIGNRVTEDMAGALGWEGGSLAMTGCDLEDNCATEGLDVPQKTSSMGGAAYLMETSATISGCRFAGNGADGEGGAMKTQSTNVVIEDSEFIDNVVNTGNCAGGLSLLWGTAEISGCTFSGNRAEAISDDFLGQSGALEIWAVDSVLVEDCVFRDNVASGDGGAAGVYDSPSVSFSRCVFAGNTADRGGGIATEQTAESTGSQMTVDHCTFAGNVAATSAADILHEDAPGLAALDITNSILWSAAGPLVMDPADADLAVTWSDVRGGFAGDGNLDADPLFVDEAGGDLHLAEGSPCIGAAEDGSDMGAYEYGTD